MYSIRVIADFCGVDMGFVRRIIESAGLQPLPTSTWERYYTFYQLELIRYELEQLIQNRIEFINGDTIISIFESKL
jgi:hypothetical protein